MALMNRRCSLAWKRFSAGRRAVLFHQFALVKEVIGLGGNIAGLVPPVVERRLVDRLKKPRAVRKAR